MLDWNMLRLFLCTISEGRWLFVTGSNFYRCITSESFYPYLQFAVFLSLPLQCSIVLKPTKCSQLEICFTRDLKITLHVVMLIAKRSLSVTSVSNMLKYFVKFYVLSAEKCARLSYVMFVQKRQESSMKSVSPWSSCIQMILHTVT